MKKIITIEGMSCSHCVKRVEKALEQLDGLKVKVQLDKKQAVVTLDKDISDEVLASSISDAGYTVKSISDKQSLFGK